jgi:hypothetical protein
LTNIIHQFNQYIRWVKRSDHRALANILQKAESNFIIEKVCNRIHEEYPDMPLFTIHDAIGTTEEGNNPSIILDTMHDEFDKLGIHPKIDREEK